MRPSRGHPPARLPVPSSSSASSLRPSPVASISTAASQGGCRKGGQGNSHPGFQSGFAHFKAYIVQAEKCYDLFLLNLRTLCSKAKRALQKKKLKISYLLLSPFLLFLISSLPLFSFFLLILSFLLYLSLLISLLLLPA
jgi:hypothetical protein